MWCQGDLERGYDVVINKPRFTHKDRAKYGNLRIQRCCGGEIKGLACLEIIDMKSLFDECFTRGLKGILDRA